MGRNVQKPDKQNKENSVQDKGSYLWETWGSGHGYREASQQLTLNIHWGCRGQTRNLDAKCTVLPQIPWAKSCLGAWATMTGMATKTSLKKQIPFVLNHAVQTASPLGSLHLCYCSFLKATEFNLPNALIFSSHIRLTLQDIAAECPVFPSSKCIRIKASKNNPFLEGLTFTLARAASPCVL